MQAVRPCGCNRSTARQHAAFARKAILLLNSWNAVFIADLALEKRLPTIGFASEQWEAGMLATYGPNVPTLYRRAGAFIDKILKGANPADLPVEQPTKFELLVNNRTAKAIGLTVPPTILTRADDVIES